MSQIKLISSNSSFFLQPTLKIAKNLLGKILARKISDKIYRYRIVETEAYCGKDDLANHAAKGKTNRNEAMFYKAGHIYVYLIYGMYYCLNIVTAAKNNPEAVLIRAVKPLFTSSLKTDGPGKLCRALKIDKSFNKQRLSKKINLWVEDDGFVVKPADINSSPRRGIEYAKHCAEYPWRFFIDRTRFIS